MNNDLRNFLKDLKQVMNKHGVSIYEDYSEHYNEETMSESVTSLYKFSGCGDSFSLEDVS